MPGIDNSGRTLRELLNDLNKELDMPKEQRSPVTPESRTELEAMIMDDPVWFGKLCMMGLSAANKARFKKGV